MYLRSARPGVSAWFTDINPILNPIGILKTLKYNHGDFNIAKVKKLHLFVFKICRGAWCK